MNIFKLAHLNRGTASQKQVNALDRFLTTLGSDRFNRYRASVGIRPGTPNRRLTKKTAYLLLREIIGDLEVTK